MKYRQVSREWETSARTVSLARNRRKKYLGLIMSNTGFKYKVLPHGIAIAMQVKQNHRYVNKTNIHLSKIIKRKVMHQLLVTTPSPSKGGDSWANEICFYFCIVLIVRGKCQGFNIPRQTWQCNVNLTDCGRELPWFYQHAVPAVWRPI